MKQSKTVQAIIDEQSFLSRLAEANRIKNNKSIIDHDAYFHRIYGYLPDDLPDNTKGIIV